MATAETVQLGPVHTPKEESIKAFSEIEIDLKKALQHLRHETNKHEPEYFHRVKNLSDKQLTNFSADDLKEVRVAISAYGMHLFGKVLLPDSDLLHSYPERSSSSYFMFRAFVGGGGETAKLHCIRLQEIEEDDGNKIFKAIFAQDDPLEWFDI